MDIQNQRDPVGPRVSDDGFACGFGRGEVS